jgi:hypothetical protein
MEVSLTFSLSWPGIRILLVSTSLIAGITGMSHQAQPSFDLKCPPKVPGLNKGLIHRVMLLESGGTFKRWDLVRGL